MRRFDPGRIAELMAELRHRHGLAPVARILEGLEALKAGDPVAGAVPDQRITFLRVPGLSATPFHPRDAFPWIPSFEAATDEILEEFRAVEAAGARHTDFEGYGQRWLAWLFASEGAWFDDTARLAPRTAALLRSVRFTEGEFLFSELGPGGLIPPHTGGCNAVLSVHLGLIVPPSARIKVGPEVRGWRKGEVLAFDDSFVHGCWNPSSERRICLVWEVWHPELSDVECAAMAFVYRSLINVPEPTPAT